MPYTDQAALIERFGLAELLAIADRDGDDAVDAGVVSQAIADADAEIDAYLGARFTVPLADPVPPLVGRLAADLARYRLQDDNPLDEVAARYRRAVDTLRELANGSAQLPLAGAGSGELAIATAAPGRRFTRDSLAAF